MSRIHCRDCLAWDDHEAKGLCRMVAPRTFRYDFAKESRFASRWPVTLPTDWCLQAIPRVTPEPGDDVRPSCSRCASVMVKRDNGDGSFRWVCEGCAK